MAAIAAPTKRIKILGRIWRLRFVPNLSTSGDCDSPATPSKEIRIWQGLRGQDRLDTIIHECLHAAHWSIDEAFVAQFATDLARILWQLGYREEEGSLGQEHDE